MKKYFSVFLLFFITTSVFAVSVVDDEGRTIELVKPAQRVITLAPSLTEMMYSVGAQDQLVATVQSSDYPVAAKEKPVVGNYERFVLEKLVSFQPDLVISWTSVNNSRQLKQLENLGIPIYKSEPRALLDISRTLKNIGILTGHTAQANRIAKAFNTRLKHLNASNKNKVELNAFYQIWYQPIYTINGKHSISNIMRLCGLKNVFESAIILAPKITVESVISHNPDMIIVNKLALMQPEWRDMWEKWPSISAVKYKNIFYIDPDLIHRQSIRILDAAELMCKQADRARLNMKRYRLKK